MKTISIENVKANLIYVTDYLFIVPNKGRCKLSYIHDVQLDRARFRF